MIFSEPHFWLFAAAVFGLVVANHIFVKSVTCQNTIILLASYFFYANWDWRFLSLIVLSTIVDFIAGIKISQSKQGKKWLLTTLFVNLSILGIFKYFNFFIQEAATLLSAIGLPTSINSLNIILPVGISFYTFQTLTYSIDIYRGKISPTRNFIQYSTYVAFFPQLVAGPIERAANLLPQFEKLWYFDESKVRSGLKLILFGLFLKVVVADNLAPTVNTIFANYEDLGGGVLLLGALYFTFQIYGDFCGYSTIAIGLAKILGYELMSNFRTPYFAYSMQDFWHRWHISLSSFFRDYVYIPLGGSRSGVFKKNRNLLITFLLSGLWHGANWTFIVWGSFHGLILILENFFRANKSRPNGHMIYFFRCLLTFTLVSLSWIIFRSETLEQAARYIIICVTEFSIPDEHRLAIKFVLLGVIVDLLWHGNERLEKPILNKLNSFVPRLLLYSIAFWCIANYMFTSTTNAFIYFQF